MSIKFRIGVKEGIEELSGLLKFGSTVGDASDKLYMRALIEQGNYSYNICITFNIVCRY